MKCIFDKPLRGDDTILLNLYKRVFPKWKYEEYVMRADQHVDVEAETKDDEMEEDA